MGVISIVSGDYKPTYNWGAPPCINQLSYLGGPTLYHPPFVQKTAPLRRKRGAAHLPPRLRCRHRPWHRCVRRGSRADGGALGAAGRQAPGALPQRSLEGLWQAAAGGHGALFLVIFDDFECFCFWGVEFCWCFFWDNGRFTVPGESTWLIFWRGEMRQSQGVKCGKNHMV